MIRYDSTVRIERPPDEIFARLTDFEGMADWTDMTDSRWLSEAGAAPGARGAAVIHLGPISRRLEWRVTDYEPGRRIGFRTEPGGAMDWDAEYVLDADAAGTNVHTAGEIRLHGLLRLLEPVIRMELPKGESRELIRLKAILEQGSPASASA